MLSIGYINILKGGAMRKSLIIFISILFSLIVFAGGFAASSKGNIDKGFYNGKFGEDQVFDVQRNPAYPVEGQQFTASNFIAPFDASVGVGTNIDWGTDRYVKFEFAGLYNDINNRTNSLESAKDEFAPNSNPPVVSLKLYESNGTLVKTISATGFVWGLSDEGFLFTAYDNDNDLGFFFTTKGAYDFGQSLTITAKKSLVINNDDLTKFNSSKDVKKSKKKKKKSFIKKAKDKIKKK